MDEPFQVAEDSGGTYRILRDHVRPSDTYGGKLRITGTNGSVQWYTQGAIMGLVAEAGPTSVTTITGWTLKDTGFGNQQNLLAGFAWNRGGFQVAPNFLWQKPLVGPMPQVTPSPGRLRNVVEDPFAVRGNREMTAGELLLSYDPTPATWLHDWDNESREDARLAGTLGFVYRHMPTAMDAAVGILADTPRMSPMSLTTSRLVAAAAILACLPLGQMIAAERSITAMSQAASRFLAELTPEQRQQASFPMTSDERLRWHFIPNEMFPRKGLAFRAMTDSQRARAHDLLKAGLSQRGYVTASAIIELENVLRGMEKGGKFARDPVDYQFTIFGTPGAKDACGWRVEGHHLSLHFTIAGGTAVASSPTFTGSNPAEVREGPEKGKRVLAPLEDLGRAMVMALDEGRRKSATYDRVAPGDILAMNRNDIAPGLQALLQRPSEQQRQKTTEHVTANGLVALVINQGAFPKRTSWCGTSPPPSTARYRPAR